jgi:hypothetical protein
MRFTKIKIGSLLSACVSLVCSIFIGCSKSAEINHDDYLFIMVGSYSNFDDLKLGSTIREEEDITNFPFINTHPDSSFLLYRIVLDGKLIKEYENTSVIRPISFQEDYSKILISGESSHPIYVIAYKYIRFDEESGKGDIYIVFKQKCKKGLFSVRIEPWPNN